MGEGKREGRWTANGNLVMEGDVCVAMCNIGVSPDRYGRVPPTTADEHHAALIGIAVSERSALLQCEEALRGAGRFIEECAKHRPLDTADIFAAMMPIRAALTLLDEARHGK